MLAEQLELVAARGRGLMRGQSAGGLGTTSCRREEWLDSTPNWRKLPAWWGDRGDQTRDEGTPNC